MNLTGGQATQLDSALTGQVATCWVTVVGDAAFASNAGSATVSAYRIGADGTLTCSGRKLGYRG